VRAASQAAQAAAATTAMPGDLEDLGGERTAAVDPAVPDKAELERLRAEVAQRAAEMTRSMAAARDGANELATKAKGAAARGQADEAAQLERKADAERARMHGMLAELATLESELKDLERALAQIGDLPRAAAEPASPPPRGKPAAGSSIDDELARLKRGTASGTAAPPRASRAAAKSEPKTVDDELAALKKKMQQPKKKP
jgi:hypothetical protein